MKKTTILRNILRATETDARLVFCNENSYIYHTNTIYFNLDTEHEIDMGFMRHLREEHEVLDCEEISETIWSLLHEIGHAETEDNLETEEDEEIAVRTVCSMIPLEDVAECEILQNLYFNLPSEWEATEWAIAFARENWEYLIEQTILLRDAR